MSANTEPIFIKSPAFGSFRIQTGLIVPLVPVAQVPLKLIGVDATEPGALVVDLWCLPLGAIGAGSFLRFFITDTSNSTTVCIAEAAITASTVSPFVRQDLGAVLPKVLSPTMTGVAGKKEALYLAPGQSLGVGLSADLASPLVVSFQGGYY